MKLWFDWLNFTWKRTTGNAKFIIVHEITKISMKLTLFYEYQKLIQIVKPLRSVCLPLSESFPFSNSKIYNFLVLLLFDGNEMQWCQSCVIQDSGWTELNKPINCLSDFWNKLAFTVIKYFDTQQVFVWNAIMWRLRDFRFFFAFL